MGFLEIVLFDFYCCIWYYYIIDTNQPRHKEPINLNLIKMSICEAVLWINLISILYFPMPVKI
jgi:hypothetical protein